MSDAVPSRCSQPLAWPPEQKLMGNQECDSLWGAWSGAAARAVLAQLEHGRMGKVPLEWKEQGE